MDGFLPPVDAASWLDHQRKRAEQFARERIAAAGATAGDWIGRATQTVDQLVPDWPVPPPPPPAPEPLAGVGDWAQGALARIGQVGSDVGAGLGAAIDRAGDVLGQEDAPDPWGPRTPGMPNVSQWASQGLRGQGQGMVDTAERDAALTGLPGMPLPGAAGMRRAAGTALLGAGNALGNVASQVDVAQSGLPTELGGTRADEAGIDYPTVAGGILGGAGAGNPYALAGSALHGGLRGAGVPEGVANVAGVVPEVLAPNTLVDDVFGLVLKGGYRVAKPAVARAVREIGLEPAARLLREAPQALVERVASLTERSAPDAAAEDAVLGIRRGQRGVRSPALTPEQQAQRARDEAAEARLFEAFQTLQRRGLSEVADDLRLYALGKGESGEQYARSMLSSQRLSDVLPRPGVGLANAPAFEDAARIDPLRSGPGALVSQGGRTLGPDDVIEVYHATSPETAAAMVTRGVLPGGKVRRGRTVIESETVAQMLGKQVGDVLDYEPGAGLGDGLYVGATPETLSQYGDAVVGVRVKVRDLLAPPERATGSGPGAVVRDDGYLPLERAIAPEDVRLVSGGMGDVVPGGVGITPTGGVADTVRAALEQFTPRYAARTSGELAADRALSAGAGIAGFATADEDATLQERLARGAGLAVLGAGLGPSGRGLLGDSARLLRGGQARDVLGAVAGTARARAPTSASEAGGLTKLGAATQIAQATPLASVPSLGWNALGGVARTAQRFLQDSLGNLDRPASIWADLVGMGGSLAPAAAAARKEFATLSPRGATAQGVAPGGLSDSSALWARVLTAGTRANAATDQFFRTLNEGGARAAAGRRGAWASADPEGLATKAGDFASFLGKNSPIADALVGAGRWANDRSLPLPRRLFGAALAGFAPYVRTPERILIATARLATDPATQTLYALPKALLKGDEAATREAIGRIGVSVPLTALFVHDYLSGELRGDPPANPTERRRQEAQGAKWNAWRGVPLTRIGPVGGAASAVATSMAAGERALLRGEHPVDLGRDVVNAMGRWALSNSYLDDLQQFSEDVASGRLAQAAEKQGVNTLTRPLSPLTSAVGAFDPSERTREGTGQELLYKLPGGRFALPERLDPTTGEPLRRRGNVASRYSGVAPGTEPSSEGQELARYGITAPDYRAGEAYQGAPLTGPQARVLQRASGSEINKATRETMATAEYRAADEAGKEKLLRAAVARGRERADVLVGEQVGRGAVQVARREYDAVPKYRGMQAGTPDEIRKKNDDIGQAKRARSAAASKGRQAEADWIKAHPDEYALTRYEGIDPARLKAQREALEKQHGVALD